MDFGRWSYVSVLVFVIVASIWLEVILRARVLRRPKRLLFTILPVVIPFLIWDAYAITQGHWYFDESRILGLYLPADSSARRTSVFHCDSICIDPHPRQLFAVSKAPNLRAGS